MSESEVENLPIERFNSYVKIISDYYKTED